jgi:acyl dehydratase
MLDYAQTRQWRSADVRHAYTTRDTILYALGVGAGANPLDERELRLVYEKDLAALPTLAAVIASPGPWMREEKHLGIDFLKLVHGEQAVALQAPLPAAGTLIGRSSVTRIVDKGEGKGAVMHVEKRLYDEATQQHVATCEQVLFLRGNGGFSAGQAADEPAPAPAEPPTGAPDLTLDLPTRADQAVLYRLSGDFNPLHIDPTVASKAGFAKPILHGLATYGIACRAIVQQLCEHRPERLQAIRARLSSPVYPGETLRLDLWRLAAGEVAFRAHVVERNVTVLSHGRAQLQASGT